MIRLLLILFLFVPSISQAGLFASLSSSCTGAVGNEGTSPGASHTTQDNIICGKYQNTLGCDVTDVSTVSLYTYSATTTTAAKMAIYADNAGAVGALLGETAEFDPSAVSTGYDDRAPSSYSGTISNGSSAWICFWADGTSGTHISGRDTTGGTHAYYNYDYSTNTGTWPATGASFSTGVNTIYIHMDAQ